MHLYSLLMFLLNGQSFLYNCRPKIVQYFKGVITYVCLSDMADEEAPRNEMAHKAYKRLKILGQGLTASH